MDLMTSVEMRGLMDDVIIVLTHTPSPSMPGANKVRRERREEISEEEERERERERERETSEYVCLIVDHTTRSESERT